MNILWMILIGLVCGGLASVFVEGKTPGGIIGVILVGIVGSILGKFLWNATLGDGNQGFIGSVILGTLGAIAVLMVLRRAKA